MSKSVTFWFDYLSPFAFFANRRIREIAAREGFSVDPVPFYHPGTPVARGVIGIEPAKLSYIVEDMMRGAKKYGLVLRPPADLDLLSDPPKAPSQRPSFLAFQWAKAQGKAWQANDAIFEGRWLHGARTGEPEVVADLLGAAGFDRDAALRAIREETFAKELDEIAARVAREGIFGIPIFVYQGQRFWGDDRIDALVEAVRAG